MTIVEQFVEKYNLRQKKYIDLSFVGDAYDYATFELAVSDINANVTTNALTNGTTGSIRVFKGEEISVIRLLQDIELTAQTSIKSNAIVDFNGFTMSEAEGYTNSYFLVSRWVENNPIGVVFYARNGGTIQTKNRTVSLGLVSEYAAVIGLTIKNNWDIINTKNDTVCSIRIGNANVETSCECKTIIEDCSVSLSSIGEAYWGRLADIYDMNYKNSKTIISNTKVMVNNENCASSCKGVSVVKNDSLKNLKMINCKVELNTTQENAASPPIGVQFDGEQLIMIDCYIKAKSDTISCIGLSRSDGITKIQNSDIIALSPDFRDSSAIGIAHNSGTSYLKDTNVFGVTSGIQNNDTIYIDGGYLRAPGHGGLYNSDNTENTGAKAYIRKTTLAQAIDEYQEFGATCSGSSGATYNAYGCYSWFDDCTFKGGRVVCKYATDETDDADRGATVHISNSYSELGYRCDHDTTLNLGVGVTGDTSVISIDDRVGTVNNTNDDYSNIVKVEIPKELYVTIADYISDLNKARIDLANLVEGNKLTTINTLVDKTYKKETSEREPIPENMEYINNLYSFKITDWNWAPEEVELYSPTAKRLSLTGSTSKTDHIKHITITCDMPLDSMGSMMSNSGWHFWNLERLTINADTSQVTDYHKMCSFIQNLKIIDGDPLNFKSRYGVNKSVFYKCPSLEEFRVVPDSIKLSLDLESNENLSNDTLDSLVAGLLDLTDASEPQSLILNSNIKTRMSEDDLKEETDPEKHGWLNIITGKNWTIA